MSVRAALLVGLLILAFGGDARAERYLAEEAGHPVRIAAYLLHPVGVLLDRAIFHPAWRLAQHEPLRTLVGMTTEERDEGPRGGSNPFLEPYAEDD